MKGFYPPSDQFRAEWDRWSAVPLQREIPTLSQGGLFPLFRGLHEAGRAPLFFDGESSNPRLSRWSFIPVDPKLVICTRGLEPISEDPFVQLRSRLSARRIARLPETPPFHSGLAGVLGYDAAWTLEKLPQSAVDDLRIPTAVFWEYDTVAAFDHTKKQGYLITAVFGSSSPEEAYDQSRERLLELEEDISKTHPDSGADGFEISNEVMSGTHSPDSYNRMILRAKEYIRSGDIYQANLSQRFSSEYRGNPIALYTRLRAINPSPFSCFVDAGEFVLASCSPERLLALSNGRAETRPIKGTRPRHGKPDMDEYLESELLSDPKENAEHVMIVDMSRNDLGRVCRYGSVSPTDWMSAERYSHVIHIVTTVSGEVRQGMGPIDVLEAVFPGASITGAPKVRCMEIIEELEPVKRGPYTGSAGWISHTGEMDFNILIRTIVMAQGMAHIQVGGGIVADSDPEREFAETFHKANAMFLAAGVTPERLEAISHPVPSGGRS